MNKKNEKYVSILISILCLSIIVVSIFLIFFAPTKQGEIPKKISETYEPSKFKNVEGFKYYDDEKYESIIGIDVSEHQKKIDWEKVSKGGVKFVMIRAGYRGAVEGKLHTDTYFKYNIEEASKYGIDVGVYFFSSAISLEEVDLEVTYLLELIEGYELQYPVVYDMEFYHSEQGRINNLTQEEKTSFALTFSEAFAERGYQTMIYGNRDWLYNQINYEKIKDYEIWYAAYQEQPNFNHNFRMWQYSNIGNIDGIETGVDMNIYIKKK